MNHLPIPQAFAHVLTRTYHIGDLVRVQVFVGEFWQRLSGFGGCFVVQMIIVIFGKHLFILGWS